jgi:hypothetical protein
LAGMQRMGLPPRIDHDPIFFPFRTFNNAKARLTLFISPIPLQTKFDQCTNFHKQKPSAPTPSG